MSRVCVRCLTFLVTISANVPTAAPAEDAELLVAPFTAAQAQAARESWAAQLGVPPERQDGVGIDLLLIPPGEFLMGSPDGEEGAETDELPQHRVRIGRPFYLGKTEVTQRAWRAVMGSTPWNGKSYIQEGDDYPATYVSWEDAAEFCRHLSEREGGTYRLPSEAEWEYACRAGTTTRFHFGESEASLGTYAWYDGNASDVYEEYAHRVGLKRANPFGLYDMHGNVWEWCSDWYDSAYFDLLGDSLPASGSGRALRGGGWIFSPHFCRSADRNLNKPASRSEILGFRVAAVPSGQ